MLRPFVNIHIQQIPTDKFPKRNFSLDINFVNEYEIQSGWECHTNTAAVKLPKNIVIESNGFLFQQRGVFNVVLGSSGYVGEGFNIDSDGASNSNPPLISRGDVISIYDGYIYKNEFGNDVKVINKSFSGFISHICSTVPIEIECEDCFYLLKRTPVNVTTWNSKLIGLCQKLLDDTNKLFGLNPKYNGRRMVGYDSENKPKYEVGNYYPTLSFFNKPDDMTANFTLGSLDIGTGLTASQLMDRLKSSFHLDSFFVDNVMQFGFPIYDEDRANSKNFFEFQNNIFESNLEYRSKDDIVLSAVVSCKVINKTGKTTRDGKESTRHERKSVLVYWDIPTETFKFIGKNKGEPFPPNDGGERHEFVYSVNPLENPNEKQLGEYGIEQLKKYFYTGFRGSFKTFGYPFVNWNDNVNIIDNVFSDRNGQYKVKKVVRSGGNGGLCQEIFLDYKQQVSIPDFDGGKKISMI